MKVSTPIKPFLLYRGRVKSYEKQVLNGKPIYLHARWIILRKEVILNPSYYFIRQKIILALKQST